MKTSSGLVPLRKDLIALLPWYYFDYSFHQNVNGYNTDQAFLTFTANGCTNYLFA